MGEILAWGSRDYISELSSPAWSSGFWIEGFKGVIPRILFNSTLDDNPGKFNSPLTGSASSFMKSSS